MDIRDEIQAATHASKPTERSVPSVDNTRSPTIAEVINKQRKMDRQKRKVIKKGGLTKALAARSESPSGKDGDVKKRKAADDKKVDNEGLKRKATELEEKKKGDKRKKASDVEQKKKLAAEKEAIKKKEAEEENRRKAEEEERRREAVEEESRRADEERKATELEEKKKKAANMKVSEKVEDKKEEVEEKKNVDEPRKKKKVRAKEEGEKMESKLKKIVKKDEVEEASNLPSIRIRTTPTQMFEATKNLSFEQKQCLRDIGFGAFIKFPISSLPGQLGYFLVDHFDPERMEINLGHSLIKVTRESVHDVFGIPKGSINIMELSDVSREEAYMNQFHENFTRFPTDTVSHKDLSQKIQLSNDHGFNFKITFLMLFANTMGRCMSNGRCVQHFLYKLKEDFNSEDYDWCQFIIECLKKTAIEWKKDKSKFFVGPITFLFMLYLDSVKSKACNVVRQRPIVINWNASLIQIVQTEESKCGGFGSLPLAAPYNAEAAFEEEGFVNPPDVDDDGPNDLFDNICNLIESVKKTQLLIEKKMHEGCKKFPSDQRFFDLGMKFDDIFKKRLYEEEVEGEEGRKDDGNNKEGMPKSVVDDGDVPSCLQEYFIMDDDLVEEFEGTGGDAGVGVCVGVEGVDKPIELVYSPYMNNLTDVGSKVKVHELKLSNWLFAMTGEKFEYIFESKFGNLGTREDLETLAPGLWVSANTVDCWSALMNYEENHKTSGSPSRVFFPSSMFLDDLHKLTEEQKFDAFKSSVNSWLKEDTLLISMLKVELVFFPIIVSNHFFVVVFNLFKKTIHIIDNSAHKVDYDVKYKRICDLVKFLFLKHLEAFKHPAYDKIKKLQKPTVMGIKWKTLHNGEDCGVFAMMHMEQYHGQAVSKWDCGIDTEGPMQRMQLIRLRIKFATKLLLHEFNTHAERLNGLVDKFTRENSRDVIKSMIKNAISNHTSRLQDLDTMKL